MNRIEKIVAFGEIMLRLTPPDYTTIEQANSFIANYGGGEANVLVSLSHLNHKTYFISKVPDNELGSSAIEHLRSHEVSVDYILRGSSTLGMYFVETGFGGRPSKVIYNRKHSAITRISEKELDFDEIFKDATWFHLSGITLALGVKVRQLALKCLKYAKKYNVKVSFDFNYRKKLWTIEEARPFYKEVIKYVDVLFANDFDLETILELKTDKKFDSMKEKMLGLSKILIESTQIDYIFGTNRAIYTSNDNSLSSYAISNDLVYHEEGPIRFNIYDRIGGGDAFDSGVIHGLLTNYQDPSYALKFGLATSVLKHTLYGDVSTLSIKEIEDFMNNKGLEVQR